MKIATTTDGLYPRYASDETTLAMLREAGFDGCDLSLFVHPWQGGLFAEDDAAFDAYFSALREKAQASGFAMAQVHAPFASATGDAAEDAHRLAVIQRAIRAAGIVGSPYIVVHPALFMVKGQPDGHAQAMAYNKTMYAALLPAARAAGVKIAIENMFRYDAKADCLAETFFSTAGEMADFLRQMDDPQLCVCLDIGHARLVGQDPAAMIRALAPWLSLLHVHDNDGLSDLHTLPYTGINDWPAICAALKEVGYAGVLSLEADGFLAKLPQEAEREALALMAQVARKLAAMAG